MYLVYFFGFFYFILGVSFSVMTYVYKFPFVLFFDMGKFWCFDYFVFWMFFDYYCLIYLFVLSYMVSSVHFFIWSYMSDEVNLVRFVLVLNSFVLSMMVLIVSPSFVSFILGWDGLGFSSFILVAWFGCDVSRYSSMKTFLTNRLGDGFLLVSLCVFFSQGHLGFLFFDYFYQFVLLFLLMVSFTKSAHFPFSNWLPDAMAAPTPVSSLVHSSTLVTAGVFLIFRFSYMYSSDLLQFMHDFGLWTLFLGSFGACFDYNSKKVVAYSTISQLGLMTFTLSVGFYSLCFFYMMGHALFKALLFISMGGVIKANYHFQDVRYLGGMWYKSPLVIFNVFFSVFSLMGFPFLSGFYLKEFMLGGNVHVKLNYLSVFLLFISIVLTVYYSVRLFYILSIGSCFLKVFSSSKVSYFCYLFVYVCVVQFGILFLNECGLWFNLDSSWYILLFSLIGCFGMFIYSLGMNLFAYLVSLSYFFYMFYLTVLNFSLTFFCSVGDYVFCILDKGFYPFSFMNYFDNIFVLVWNSLIKSSFFSNWLYLLGLSFCFLLCMYFFWDKFLFYFENKMWSFS